MVGSTRSVTHVSFSSLGGAGAVAARLTRAQHRLGWTSTLKTLTDEPFRRWAIRHPLVAASTLIDYLIVRKTKRSSFFSLFRQQHSSRHARLLASEPGVLHLHWLPGFVRVEDLLPRVTARIIVWSLHDFFPLTGGCHYPYGCDHFADSCRECPQVRRVFRPKVRRRLLGKKRAYEQAGNLVVVAPSHWAKSLVHKSSAMHHMRCDVIPNPVDTSVFAPQPRTALMRTLGIPTGSFVIGVGAADLQDGRKQISTTLRLIQSWIADRLNSQRFHVFVFGDNPSSQWRTLGPQFHFIGSTREQDRLAEWYALMDVYVSLSRYETFGNTVAEAAACGTPAVCLAGSGMTDVVIHNSTGLHIRQEKDLAGALRVLVDHPEKLHSMGIAARHHAVESFDDAVIANRFISLYLSHAEA